MAMPTIRHGRTAGADSRMGLPTIVALPTTYLEPTGSQRRTRARCCPDRYLDGFWKFLRSGALGREPLRLGLEEVGVVSHRPRLGVACAAARRCGCGCLVGERRRARRVRGAKCFELWLSTPAAFLRQRGEGMCAGVVLELERLEEVAGLRRHDAAVRLMRPPKQ